MQGDGNLVVYLGEQPLFNTRTQGNPGARLVMQSDGNLVVLSPDDQVLFQSRTRQPGCQIEIRPVFGGRFEDGVRVSDGQPCTVPVPLIPIPVFVFPLFDPFSLGIDACVGIARFSGFRELELGF